MQTEYLFKAIDLGGEEVTGYYVKYKDKHYILVEYYLDDNGFDEGADTHDWREIDFKTLELIKP